MAANSSRSKPLVNVVWFKCTDLRTHDHAPLKAAHQDSLPIIHLYVFDPFWHAGRTRICGFPKTGAIRNRFQIEAVEDLKHRLAAKGLELCVRKNVSTATCFEELCEDFAVNAVFAFREICSEELHVERQVSKVLGRHGRNCLKLFWGFELYHHDDLSFNPLRPKAAFNSYTAFRKRVEEGSRVRPSSQEDPSFRGQESLIKWSRATDTLPTVQEVMGSMYDPAADPGKEKDPRAEMTWQGGETAAFKRIQLYLWEEDSLGLEYVGATMTMDTAKSCMRDKAMSKLSPWLAHGCISARRLYEEVKRYERERRKTKSTYWIIHELLWRDFVRFGSIHAGTSIFKIGGPKNETPRWRWSTDQETLKAWIHGNTGFPFIDCFMRELKTTGYCNHMGRECAGWFLIGDLGLDWRMAAEWFESILIDYEPTANWFNWTYRCLPAAGRSETPGERLRGLEILKWGAQHDPDASYIKRWIPALSQLPATIAREPWRLGLNKAESDLGEFLRPAPTGKFNVSKGALQRVLALGFSEEDAAIALYRAREDVDAAVALLLGEGPEGQGQGTTETDGDEDDDLAYAMALSMGMEPKRKEKRSNSMGNQADSGFRYGQDYPMPVIQPVSLTNTEGIEDEARREQSKRDEQISASKRHKGSRGTAFEKPQWEHSRQQWAAETPTAAVVNSKYSQNGSQSAKGKGKWRPANNFSNSGGKGDNARLDASDEKSQKADGSGRRWGNRIVGA